MTSFGRARILALTLSLLAFVGCETQAPPGLWSAVISDPKTFNPILVTDAGSSEALAPVFEALLRRDPKTLEMKPLLAERWEHDPTGTEWTFHLRRDVHWHDGEPFTAADVVFTYGAIFDERVPNSAEPILSLAGEPRRVHAVDDHTVRFILPRPFAPFLASMPVEILPEHILGAPLAAGKLAETWGIDTPPTAIVGTGPFRLAQYVPAQFLRYERNPGYWMRDEQGTQLPHLTNRTILIVPDQNASYLKFLARQTHYHLPRPEEVSELESRAADLEVQVEEMGIEASTLFLTFNRNPARYAKADGADPRLSWFTDLHFLRAIAHAVDKESIVRNCLAGRGRPAVAKFSPADTVFHHPGLEDYAYDLEAARASLRAGGYTLEGGALHDAAGNRVAFSLTTNSGNKVRERLCSILKEDWAKLGIQVNYRPVDFTTLVEKLDRTFDWDVVLIGFTGSPEPHNSANLLLSSGNLHLWHPSQETPATEWEAEVDRLIEQATRTLDIDERARLYRRVQEILHEQLPMIQTVHHKLYVAYDGRLEGFERTVWGQRRPERIRFSP